jgi:hypothetical protein
MIAIILMTSVVITLGFTMSQQSLASSIPETRSIKFYPNGIALHCKAPRAAMDTTSVVLPDHEKFRVQLPQLCLQRADSDDFPAAMVLTPLATPSTYVVQFDTKLRQRSTELQLTADPGRVLFIGIASTIVSMIFV